MSMTTKNDLITLNTNEMSILNVFMSHLSIQTNTNNNNNENNMKPLIILGPSGVGKDTMINMLLDKYPKLLYKLPSYTTRDKRPGEKKGKDYNFITKEKFKVMKNENKLMGIQNYNDNFYASNKSKLEKFN